ncbi:zinc-binding dehydrogenase [Micromonospora chalcea]|uniref:zinc-binding dehydrogenase n=1 Tax=Micromonospora chalcea TaxID=1874 RepID=UPI003CEB2FA3
MAKLLGAVVIGAVPSAATERAAREAGADHIIRYGKDDVVEQVRRLAGGVGVGVVYDGVGRATFEASLASLRPRGLLVLFGQLSGPVPPFDPQRLTIFRPPPSPRRRSYPPKSPTASPSPSVRMIAGVSTGFCGGPR